MISRLWPLVCLAMWSSPSLAHAAVAVPIVIANYDPAKIDFTRSDGGLPHLPNVTNIEVYHAQPNGYTYNHHVDVARWKGRLYLGFNQCLKDEDTWPSREVLVSSIDGGQTWTAPQEMFPQGISTALRTYFFIAPNGKMLILAGLRVSHEKVSERKKGSLVVRELTTDHKLGRVYTLRSVGVVPVDKSADFTTAADLDFVQACRQLLADHVFLQQQDYGLLVDQRDRIPRMDTRHWPSAEPSADQPEDYGKATCFFHRGSELVGICKHGWVTTSQDRGKTWSQPTIPPTLVTGMGKVWCQSTQGGYIMAYNPHPKKRQPLVLATSTDGITFNIVGSLNPDIPPMRYPGKAKDPGAQYIRGISEWADDHSFDDHHLCLAYSINKEDIFVARLLVPVLKQ